MHELSYLMAALLGFVQGATEFIPISSSGHLVVLQQWFGLTLPAEELLAIDVCLHFGSLIALIIVFWNAIWALLKKPRLVGLLILGTIPAVIVGLGLKEPMTALFSSVRAAGWGWLLTGVILLLTRYCRPGEVTETSLRVKHVLWIGLAQAVAIIPSISRSGMTIASALFLGLTRSFAGEFSFLLGLPAIGGAVLLEGKSIFGIDPAARGPLLVGTLISFVVSYFSLLLLMRFIRAGKVHYFAYYCFAIGIVSLLLP